MLEVLVLSLGLLDQAYFLKEDIRDKFFNLLQSLPEQQLVVLLGLPELWDIKKNTELHYYSAYKWTSGKSIESFPPEKYGVIVLSSLKTGEIRILPLIDNSHKMPMPISGKKPSPPAGAKLDKKTIGYDESWGNLLVNDVAWAGGDIAIAVLCGSTISNVRKLVLQPIFLVEEKLQLSNDTNISNSFFEKTIYSPDIPDSIGINISIADKQERTLKESYIIYGSFKLLYENNEDIVIHLLFADPSVPGLHEYSARIPQIKISVKGNSLEGYFTFDIKSTAFWNPDKKNISIPSLFISTVCKGVFSAPQRFAFKL